MTATTELTPDLIERVTKLSPAGKQALLGLLVEGADGPVEDLEAVKAAWKGELAVRIADLESGRVRPVDFKEALAKLRQKLRTEYGV